jgi:type I restriction enzyme S subunit
MSEDRLPEIPREWRWIKVSDVIKKCSLTGKKVKQRQVKKEGKYPVIDQGQEFISGYVDDENLVIECEPPIIVFGDHTKIIKYVNFEFVAGADGVKAFKPLSIYHPKAFYYLLKAIKLPDKGYARHFQFLEKSPIPILPLPEQQKIVEILEDVFSKIDAGVEGLKKIKKLLSIYRKAVLKYAFEGELTEKWRKENKDKLEPVEELIKKIRKEKEERYKRELEKWKKACEIAKKEGKKRPPKPKKPKDLPLITEEGLKDLPSIPKEWVWVRLGELIEIYDHLRVPLNQQERKQKKKGKVFYPYYGATGKVDEIDEYIFDGEYLLIGEDGVQFFEKNKTKAYIVHGKFWANNHVHVVKAVKGISNRFLMHYLNICDYHGYVTGTTRLKLNQSFMKNIPVPLTSTLEQQKIVEEIEYRLSLADKLEETVNKLLEKIEKLKQSYLKYAFEGKLTEEWRKQNPHLITGENSVERLLEMIIREKKKSGKQKKGRNTRRALNRS